MGGGGVDGRWWGGWEVVGWVGGGWLWRVDSQRQVIPSTRTHAAILCLH